MSMTTMAIHSSAAAPPKPRLTIADIRDIAAAGFEYAREPDVFQRFTQVISAVSAPGTVVVWPTFAPTLASSAWKYENSAAKVNKTEGIDKDFSAIRLQLNKLSNKTFDSIEPTVHGVLDRIFECPDYQAEAVTQVSRNIFDIASQNKFYSNLYARLYANLAAKYPPFVQPFHEKYEEYMRLFDTIVCTDPNEDYDEYCKNNKANEKIRAISTFFVNSVATGMLTREAITRMFGTLMDTTLAQVNEEGKTGEVNEYIENLCILYDKQALLMTEELGDKVRALAALKPAGCQSLTNKSMFKLRDAVEAYDRA